MGVTIVNMNGTIVVSGHGRDGRGGQYARLVREQARQDLQHQKFQQQCRHHQVVPLELAKEVELEPGACFY